ncbi:dihydrofolate reductase [Sphingomonas spermidinifaciens]|uniref:Dihydrofolate reductase n=1 Tax=Sphingomonas spermidinifaciens TaxID=1141889 RepID=A0A2A4B334_9SPHN|nr:2-hydroxyacid dehydrogenase [Sphingomonas spermidinifaciens]PCD02046.1 dihydrofolate reductase [Sphingomonas spermidinifaciens]
MTRPILLQLSPMSADLEAALDARGERVRLDTPDAGWLAGHGARVRIVVTGGQTGAPRELVEALPNLGLIAINGVGFDKVDIGHAAARGVAVTNTPGVLTDDVADLAIGLVIGLLRDLPRADAHVRSGAWTRGELPLARKVTGRRFGIVGLGRIGSAIAERLKPFGPVAYTGRSRKPVELAFHPDAAALAVASDVLIVAAAASAETRHLIDAKVLAALGPGGVLVNVARGSVVDEAALVAAIEGGRIAGAALDVFEGEPHVPPEITASDRTMLTPHIASATVETRAAMAALVLENIDAFLAGRPLATPIPPP